MAVSTCSSIVNVYGVIFFMLILVLSLYVYPCVSMCIVIVYGVICYYFNYNYFINYIYIIYIIIYYIIL